jgi:Fe-S cluster biogenesis protein NfuA
MMMAPSRIDPKTELQMKALLEQLSAYIETFHGGSVEYVDFDGKVLKVRLGGACLGCPLSPSTLHGWVEGTVRQFFPDIEGVESVTPDRPDIAEKPA